MIWKMTSNVNYLYEELEYLGEVYSDEKKFNCLYKMIFHRKNWDNLMAYIIDVVPTPKQLQKQKGIIR